MRVLPIVVSLFTLAGCASPVAQLADCDADPTCTLPDAEADADTDSDVDTDSDADTDTDSDADTDSDSDADTDSDTDADTDSDTDADTDSDTDTDSDADTDSDTDSDADTDTDSDVDTDTDTDTDTDSDTDTDADTDPVLCFMDDDSDHFGGAHDPTCSSGSILVGGDCNDSEDSIHPGAPETCDGVDSNCDGFAELDADLDGSFAPTSGDPAPAQVGACDCNDNDADVHPQPSERCDPLQVDNDCNAGTSDAGLITNGTLTINYTTIADALADTTADVVNVCGTESHTTNYFPLQGTVERDLSLRGFPTDDTTGKPVLLGSVARILEIQPPTAGPSPTVTLRGLAIDGNNTPCLRATGSQLVLDEVDAYQCRSVDTGGAVHCDGCSLSIINSTFRDNSAGNGGGALDVSHSPTTVSIHGSSFSDNGSLANNGGAIRIFQSAGLSITETAFDANQAHLGGAIHASLSGNLTLSGTTTFASNIANAPFQPKGGALWVGDSSSLSIGPGASFALNEAERGGAIYTNNVTLLTVDEATFTDNEGIGAGLFAATTQATLLDSVFTGNQGPVVRLQDPTDGSSITGNTFQDSHTSSGVAASLYASAVGAVDLDLQDNTFDNETGPAVIRLDLVGTGTLTSNSLLGSGMGTGLVVLGAHTFSDLYISDFETALEVGPTTLTLESATLVDNHIDVRLAEPTSNLDVSAHVTWDVTPADVVTSNLQCDLPDETPTLCNGTTGCDVCAVVTEP